ncbi:hypothetical protein SESBI_11073 [Sesbania bispinosa]|nr:hypothetical protein SESBI_11073 [Sesbania bispinosa]
MASAHGGLVDGGPIAESQIGSRRRYRRTRDGSSMKTGLDGGGLNKITTMIGPE